MPKKKRRKRTLSGRLGVYVVLNKDMSEALEEVRDQLSLLKGEGQIALSAIVRMYLEKGLTADKALPRPVSSEDKSHA